MDVDSKLDLKEKFSGFENFFDLLLKHIDRQEHVICRIYSHGSWHQLSGQDVSAHISKSIQYLEELIPVEKSRKQKTKSIIFLTKNSYASFITSLACQFMGYNACFVSSQTPQADLKWCIDYFNCSAIITDIENHKIKLDELKIPVVAIDKTIWMPQEKYPEPKVLSIYRKYKSNGYLEDKLTHVAIKNIKLGQLGFISVGHDGIQKPELMKPDFLMLVAESFSQHSQVPSHILWHSFEIMPPNNPFVHLSRFCALLNDGIIGFQNSSGDLESNLRILKPTYIFLGPPELNQLVNLLSQYFDHFESQTKEKIAQKIAVVQNFLGTNKAMKIPGNILSKVKRAVIFGSKVMARGHISATGFEDLKFIVHGLSAANEQLIKKCETIGVTALETYGTTHAGGMLTSSVYSSYHCGSIGTPLPHVSIRLGAHSSLEYKINMESQEQYQKWTESGDIVQMTPFGLIVTGRKKHLFTTSGGSIVSPFRLEKLLKEDPTIIDACVVGDKMPYLCALIVLNKDKINSEDKSEASLHYHVQNIISKINETLPRNLTLKKFIILDKPFSEAGGERLFNGEINRLKIMESRSKMIESLYN